MIGVCVANVPVSFRAVLRIVIVLSEVGMKTRHADVARRLVYVLPRRDLLIRLGERGTRAETENMVRNKLDPADEILLAVLTESLHRRIDRGARCPAEESVTRGSERRFSRVPWIKRRCLLDRDGGRSFRLGLKLNRRGYLLNASLEFALFRLGECSILQNVLSRDQSPSPRRSCAYVFFENVLQFLQPLFSTFRIQSIAFGKLRRSNR